MTDSDKIVCKPTPWFLFRAGVMVLMFGVFSFLFYKDGTVGYRQKNASYYLRSTFEAAASDYQAQAAKGPVSPEEWRKYAQQQPVKLPADGNVLPPEVQPGMKWPEPLHDAQAVKSRQWTELWNEYSKNWGQTHSWNMDAIPPHEPFDAGKIREQLIVLGICLTLTLIALFFLIRTLRRSIAIDGEALYTQTGKRVPFADLKRLDIRKWEGKGLALADYEGPSGTGKVRIDGLTYGGFKKEQGEPAEALMRRLRSHFTGELVEYAPADSAEVDTPAADT